VVPSSLDEQILARRFFVILTIFRPQFACFRRMVINLYKGSFRLARSVKSLRSNVLWRPLYVRLYLARLLL